MLTLRIIHAMYFLQFSGIQFYTGIGRKYQVLAFFSVKYNVFYKEKKTKSCYGICSQVQFLASRVRESQRLDLGTIFASNETAFSQKIRVLDYVVPWPDCVSML